jgi:hypothetical protein
MSIYTHTTTTTSPNIPAWLDLFSDVITCKKVRFFTASQDLLKNQDLKWEYLIKPPKAYGLESACSSKPRWYEVLCQRTDCFDDRLMWFGFHPATRYRLHQGGSA